MTADGTARCEAIAIGGSAGALRIVTGLVQALPGDFRIPILLCLHLHRTDQGQLANLLDQSGAITVVDGCDKMPVLGGRVHVAPANYHLLVERTRTLALTTDAKLHHCRPSIDVLFESAASTYGAHLLAMLLSGANEDGAAGLGVVKSRGGLTVVQDPATAEFPVMPRAAVDGGVARLILAPEEITRFVLRLCGNPALDAAMGGGSS